LEDKKGGITELTSKDHVDIVLDTKPKVVLVLLRERGQINVGVGQIHALAGRDKPVVPRPDLDGLVVDNLQHIKRQDTVVHVDDPPRLNYLGDVLVVHVPWLELACVPSP
jgi:predicted RNA-binding protein with EMAP domain